MKHIIVAQNGTIEIPEHLDVDIWTAHVSAKNTWAKVGGEFYRFKPGDILLAAHVFGKNTAATQMVFLKTRLYDFTTYPTDYRAEAYFGSQEAGKRLDNMTDVNYVFKADELWNCLYEIYPTSVMEFSVDNSSNFTGSLSVDFYILRGSR